MSRIRLSRRAFLASAAGASIAVVAGGGAWMMWPETVTTGNAINAFVALLPDGAVEFVCPAQDLGQGGPHTLAMILAEEIGASLDRIAILAAPRDASRYGNPEFMGRMVTADSKTTMGYWPILRLAGAETRAAMIATAARARGWRIADCDTRDHAVHHQPDGATMGFDAIAAMGSLVMPSTAAPARNDARPPAILGTSPEEPDARDIVMGKKRFGADRRAPDVPVCVLKRSRYLGGLLISHDDQATRAVPGVIDVIALEDAVAVIAENSWAAIRGAGTIEATWSDPGDFDSETHEKALRAALDDTNGVFVTLRDAGAPIAAPAGATTFYAPSLTHVLPEPLNATATPIHMGLSVRTESTTQSLELDMRFAAPTWKMAPPLVETEGLPAGGAYGRRVLNDTVRDACAVAKKLGRPVQVIRPLSDEFQRGQVRPAAVQRIAASLDAAGNLAIWQHDIASNGTLATQLPTSLKGPNKDEDNTATDGARHAYRVPQEAIRWTRVAAEPVPGFLRGVAAGYTIWAIETTVERLARGAGQDPLDWRLRHIDDQRLQNAIRRVGAMAGWDGATGRHLGLAAMIFRKARIATIAEVRDNTPIALWIAADVGQAVHETRVLKQIEGGAYWGLSQALLEECRFTHGACDAASLADYPVLGNDALPAINIELIPVHGAPPSGVGEVGIPTTVAALANAFERATGRQFDRLPLAI